MADVLPGYAFNPDTGRYRNVSTGRFVARREVTSLLDNQIRSAESRLSDLTTAMHDGRLSPAAWQEHMGTELRRLHSQNRALAVGGWDRMRSADWGAVGGRLRPDYLRIERLAQDVANGDCTLPQALNRVNGYIGSARIQFWEADRAQRQPAAGNVNLERRQLGIAEHCADCVDYADRGWQASGSLPVPGTGSECNTHCRCMMAFREVPMEQADSYIGTRR